MLALCCSSCFKPAPTQEETRPQEELVLQEELKPQEEAERSQRINEQYPFSFGAPAVKTYRYEDNHRLYGLDGDWVYYSSGKSDDDRNWICRSRLDGSDKTWIASMEYQKIAYWFVAYGEWIFYLDFGAGKSNWGRIYRINNDGTQKTPMEEIYSNSLYLQDDWLYYTRYGTVGRMRPDGSAHEIIFEKEGLYYSFLAEDWLYVSVFDSYTSGIPPLELYRVHISGSPVIRLDNDDLRPSNIQVSGDWVYFQSWNRFYRIPIEGGEAENLFEGREFILGDYDKYCVVGDWIVFTQRKKFHQAPVVYRMLTDGSYVEMITDTLPASIHLWTNSTLLSRGYLKYSERVRDSEGNLAGYHRILYKLDNEGQLHAVFEADYYLNFLAFHENGIIYKGNSGVRWISLEQD